MKAAKFEDLPTERRCNDCGETKPREQMIVQSRGGVYYFRPKCKDCHNARERGHRREYKRNYLQKWRRQNADLNKSYWDNDQGRERSRINAEAAEFGEQHEAILIQGRLGRRGMNVTVVEAKELLAKYGRCYPSRFGLTQKGLRECERIRSRLRSRAERRRMPSGLEIRIMVYEMSDEEPGIIIPPDKQPVPYQIASQNLKDHHLKMRATA